MKNVLEYLKTKGRRRSSAFLSYRGEMELRLARRPHRSSRVVMNAGRVAVARRRFRPQLAVQLDVALRLDVVLPALRHVGDGGPDEQLHKVRDLALASGDLQ